MQASSFVYNNKAIPIYDYSYLSELNTQDYSFLITDGYYREVFEKVKNELGEAADLTVYFYPNLDTKLYLQYHEKFKHDELEDVILFRSGPAANARLHECEFYDNARALFEYMLKNNYNEKYRLVWLVIDPEKYIQKYASYKNVYFLSYYGATTDNEEQREQYYRALCLAKWIFFTDAYGFAREKRNGQTRVQLWHGCGFKTRVNFVRCEHRYEYTTVISDLYSDIHQNIYGLRPDQMLITGYAKQDWVFEGTAYDIKKHFNISRTTKLILWLPTFRKAVERLSFASCAGDSFDTGLPLINDKKELVDLNEHLKKENVYILIKTHPFQDETKTDVSNLSNISILSNKWLAEQDININQIFNQTDALISDYSSGAVDYMLTDKPIAFTLDDVEEYEVSRGFVFDNIREWLPGKEIWNYKNMCEFIDMVALGEDDDREKRRSLRAKMHKYNDGNSCKRIIEALGIER